jgi:lysophospholipase L1-like esterase
MGCGETTGAGGSGGSAGDGGAGGSAPVKSGLWLGGNPSSNTDGTEFDTGWAICFNVNEDGTALVASADCDIDQDDDEAYFFEVGWKDDVGKDDEGEVGVCNGNPNPDSESMGFGALSANDVVIEDNSFLIRLEGYTISWMIDGDLATGTAQWILSLGMGGAACELVGAWTAAPATEAVRVAFIGDSITEPVGTPATPVNYPEHLVSLLGDEFDLGNFGVGGATMSRVGSFSYWDLPEFAEAKAFEPHVVTIMLGTNDTKPAIWDADAYEQDYRDMVEEMESLPSKPTLLLLRPVPVFGENDFLIRGDVLRDEVLPIIDRLGVEYDLVVVDLYTPLLEHGDLFPDNVHPTAAGGLLIAERLIEALVSAASTRGFEITRNASPIAAE